MDLCRVACIWPEHPDAALTLFFDDHRRRPDPFSHDPRRRPCPIPGLVSTGRHNYATAVVRSSSCGRGLLPSPRSYNIVFPTWDSGTTKVFYESYHQFWGESAGRCVRRRALTALEWEQHQTTLNDKSHWGAPGVAVLWNTSRPGQLVGIEGWICCL